MKTPYFTYVAALTLALATAGLGRVVADDINDQDSNGGHHWHHDSVLTADERAELKKDRDQVFAANPDLKTEGKDLWSQRPAKDASADDKKAFFEKMRAYHDKVDGEIEKIDPNATALIDKLKAAHHHHHDDGGSSSNS